MPIIEVILVLVILGVALYFIEAYIPMAAPIKLLIRIVVVIFVVLWLLQMIGFIGPTVPKLR